jgi:fatty acid amide hydrolase
MAGPDAAAAAVQTASSIAHAVASGQQPPAEPLSEHIARHHATHASLNALVQPRHAAARRDAERLEWAVQRAAPLALAGVPVSVKECFGVAGLVTTLGIPARRRALDDADAPLVARLREAGAIIVGKANVPQAMYLHETDNPVWGRTNHPLDPTRGPGGSSGGDAALVAAGVVPLAIGTDLAGSIRQPAHACGIFGLLPRSASLGDGGAFDTMPRLVAVRPRAGFLARTVDDLALALEVVAGGPLAAGPQAGRSASLRVGTWDETGPLEPAAAVRRAVA